MEGGSSIAQERSSTASVCTGTVATAASCHAAFLQKLMPFCVDAFTRTVTLRSAPYVRIQCTRYLRPARGPTATLNAGARITSTRGSTQDGSGRGQGPRVGGATGQWQQQQGPCNRVERVGRGVHPCAARLVVWPRSAARPFKSRSWGGFFVRLRRTRRDPARGMDTNHPFCCGCKNCQQWSAVPAAAAAAPVA